MSSLCEFISANKKFLHLGWNMAKAVSEGRIYPSPAEGWPHGGPWTVLEIGYHLFGWQHTRAPSSLRSLESAVTHLQVWVR
jgi:hypothetical protein